MHSLPRRWLPLLLLGLVHAAPARSQGLELRFFQRASSPERPRFVFEGGIDGISIRHEHASFNCCLEFGATVELLGDVLLVTEHNGGPPCRCADVPWDVGVEILGLEPGAYDVYYHAEDGNLLATAETVVPGTETSVFVRGAVNDDEAVDMSDAVAALGYLYLGERPPACLDAGDVNDDGVFDLSDPVHLLGYLFLGGPAPPAPFATPGEDPTPDAVVCSLANRVIAVSFVRDGDLNGDGTRDISDGIAFLNFLVLGGPLPACADALDTNDDGVLSLEDLCGICPSCCPSPLIVGTPPPDDGCKIDSTPDRLGCDGPGC